MSNRSNAVITPVLHRKRKERDGIDGVKEPSVAPAGDNRLLAGYLAHEFLTRGTLFGRKWDPARAGPGECPNKPGAVSRPVVGSGVNVPGAYADVSRLVKTDGVHIPGIVNPTQLGRWIQM